jgi:hypothetical protein
MIVVCHVFVVTVYIGVIVIVLVIVLMRMLSIFRPKNSNAIAMMTMRQQLMREPEGVREEE